MANLIIFSSIVLLSIRVKLCVLQTINHHTLQKYRQHKVEGVQKSVWTKITFLVCYIYMTSLKENGCQVCDEMNGR